MSKRCPRCGGGTRPLRCAAIRIRVFRWRASRKKRFPGNAIAYYFSGNLKTASVTHSAGVIKAESDYYSPPRYLGEAGSAVFAGAGETGIAAGAPGVVVAPMGLPGVRPLR